MHRYREPEERTGELVGQLARRLARKEIVAAGRFRPRRFRRRLRELERSLGSLHRRFRESEELRDLHPRIAEWLLDNSYLTRGALRQIQDTLSPGFLRDLPKLADPEAPMGRPRVRVLASALVEHSRVELDTDDLLRFMHAFQEISYLSLGELWALSPMLQLAVLETMDSIVGELPTSADAIESAAGAGTGAGAFDPVRTVAACVESLRLIEGYDWRTFVETVSRVEATLRQDPAAVYERMEPESRDRYRRAVEQIARGCGGYEAETRVAEHAVRRARDAPSSGETGRERHVGHYLIDAGREELERELECRPSWKSRRRRWILRHAQSLYLGSVGATTVGALAVLGIIAGSSNMGRMSILLTLVAGVVPAVTMAVSLVNWLAVHLVPPRILPKLELKKRVPAELRTVVALPVLIGDRRELEELLRHLEVLRHANPLRGLSFVLLTDLPDAPERVMPGDAELVEMARRGIRELNAASDGARPFSLLHRERHWNAAEDCWMGWERKRGKLHELNRFLVGAEDTGFVVREGDPERFRGARFVITLDADTILPPEAAARLIGTLGHPLNRPEVAPDGRITAGYSVLQPRIDVMPRGGSETPFASLGQDADGLDLYSHAASDVYQDLFGEGLYAGKGIYDVHAFHASLSGRVPENAILSHDLFEGLHGRAGLASDIRVFEEYPAHVEAYLRRLHRWIRGDWQLVPWLGAKVPGKGGERLESRFGRLDRWKILDNLRRSLVAPSLLALLGIGWLTSGAAWVWPALVLGVYALPVFLGAAGATRRFVHAQRLRPRRHRASGADLARATWSGSARAIGRWLLALLLLPFEALIAIDAIVRTLHRIVVSRRHLLRWTSAAHMSRRLDGSARLSIWTRLWQGPVVGIGVVLLVTLGRPENLPATATFAAAWIVSPYIAGFLGRPRPVRKDEMSADGRRRLRAVALHTWYYFERLIDSEHNWLPPDNFREDHESRVARRTSPTNIGMMLGATQAAFDLGFVDVLLFEATIRNALDSIAKLERYRGHLLNWYSTSDLRSLEPRYVSTVDSGNLAASLLAVSRGLQDAGRHQPLGRREIHGLCDSLAALRLAAHAVCSSTRELAALDSRIEAAESDLRSAENDPRRIFAALRRMDETHVPAVEDALAGLLEAPSSTLDERRMVDLRTWARKLRQHVGTLRRLQRRLLPWLALSSDPAAEEVPPALRDALGGAARLCDLPEKIVSIRDSLDRWEQEGAAEATRGWRSELRAVLDTAAEEAERVLDGLSESSAEMLALVDEMDFRFLFDPERELFHIGFDVTAEAADPHHYDLLASEARVASLLAIARGDVPPVHWLRLGRPFGRVRGKRVLLSWGATMFEYLLPPLFTRMPEGSLLHHACDQAVRGQKHFAEERGIPWGISESSYFGSDVDADYPYRAFGVPDLGLRRDLGERLVVAPYATMLALPVAPRSVEENLERLDGLGMLGPLGPYEALDYGPPMDHTAREPRIVRAYMAHHQGMILVAVDNYLNGDVMVERFHADPRIRAVEHLLHERIPWQVPARRGWTRPEAPVRVQTAPSPVVDWVADPTARRPDVHLLSNGRYSVLITARGAGGSRWDGRAVTRWRADPTLERYGSWIYLCEPETGDVWSASPSPTDREPEWSRVNFAPHTVEIQRRDAGIFAHTGITVAVDDDVEIRHLKIANESERRRRLAIASYGEVVLGSTGEDRRHPAYSKLFVESEALQHRRTLLFRRRPRRDDERSVHLGHALVGAEGSTKNFAWEADRAVFLGRGGDPAHPAALEGGRLGLSGSTGATLDPIYSLGCEVELAPYESVDLVFVTAAGASRSEVLGLLDRYRSVHRCETAVDWARERAALLLETHDLAPRRAQEVQRLHSGLVHRGPASGESRPIDTTGPSRSGLWKHGISGDLPVLLVRVEAPEAASLVDELLRAHAYLHEQGARFDLVILDRAPSGYAQPLRDRLQGLLERRGSAGLLGRRGGVHIVDLQRAEGSELELLESCARVVLEDGETGLGHQLEKDHEPPARLPAFVSVPSAPLEFEDTPPLPPPDDLLAFNGFGGFSPEGREYVIRLEQDMRTPAPWANVIANPSFGSLVTETGGGYTWAHNAGLNRLTPWRNDPVVDLPGEVVYLRDEETGEVWTTTPAPAGPSEGSAAVCEVRHGTGYTIFRRRSHGLEQELTLFCAPDDPVKIFRLRLSNLWQRQRRVTATCFVEWVLGTDVGGDGPHVVTGYDAEAELLLARNPFNDDFGGRFAFVGSSSNPHGVTTDRTEFLGRDGDHSRPAGLYRIGLSGRIGGAVDPCAAYQVHLDISPGAETEVLFLLGEGESREEAVRLGRRYGDPSETAAAFEAGRDSWDELLGGLTVETPEPALDVMLNRWLLYQTVSSRLWGRTGLYQSSGAFGFRDQLQDVLALLDAAPDLARGHLLRAAARQFEEGDVLHWWQPGTTTGVRTRCSDDLLWLPYATALYVKRTGDAEVLDEAEPFLRGEPLQAGEDERYGSYESATEHADLYHHCLRAIDRGTTRGEHGLPLIGGGDWNDGFDRVGREGRGESVWLAWFLAAVLEEFAPLCEDRNDRDRARSFRQRAERLRRRIDEVAWDGRWYHRAYYDDGTPLGSTRNREGRIDAISQAWSVLAGKNEERSRTAMDAVAEHLVLDAERLVLLLAPPFDRTDRDPGYIKGYPPGVRENGGQYTHAAAWVGWAFAALGDSEAAGRVLGYLNPVLRTTNRESVMRYRVEPYVVAADIYGVQPHVGRGGWTWYTGSAAWLYRFAVEAVLGLRREGDRLHVTPNLPPGWEGYRAELRHGSARYRIEVTRTVEEEGEAVAVGIRVDGRDIGRGPVTLIDDGEAHEVKVRVGPSPTAGLSEPRAG